MSFPAHFGNNIMKTGYSFKFSGNYIYVRHFEDFIVSAQSMNIFWEDLAAFCKTYNCKKVLAEGNIFKRKMSTVEAFQFGNTAGKKILGLWLAFVFPEYQADVTTDFFKTVAKNRGVRIDFFNDYEDALQWLNVIERMNAA